MKKMLLMTLSLMFSYWLMAQPGSEATFRMIPQMKAPATPEFVLDSTVSRQPTGEIRWKNTFLYDQNGRVTDQAMYNVVNGKYKGSYRQTAGFTDNGSQNFTQTYQWDVSSSNWQPLTKEILDLSPTGQRLVTESYTYSNNQWIGVTKSESSFDQNDVLLGNNFSMWDATATNWKIMSKVETEKNGNELILNTLVYIGDDNNLFLYQKAKFVYTYTNQDDISTSEYYLWAADKNSWQPSVKRAYSYNSNGQITQLETFSRDTLANSWVINARTIKDYTSEGRIILNETYGLNASTKALDGLTKYRYAYDNNGNQTLNETMSWVATTSTWRTAMITTSTYNDNHQLTLEESYRWENEFSSLCGSGKRVMTYTADNLVESNTLYHWDQFAVGGPTWFYSQQRNYTYDAENYLTQLEYLRWDEEEQEWVVGNRNVHTWELNHQQETDVFETRDVFTSEWILSTKQVNTFDVNKNPSFQENFNWSSINGWQSTGSNTYYYSSFVPTKLSKPASKPGITAWSTESTLHIETATANQTISVYSVDGKRITTQQLISGSLEIQLPKGLYLVKTTTGVLKIAVN